MKELTEVLQQVNKKTFNIRKTATGDTIINPVERRQLRNKIREAIRDDINNALPAEVGEAFINADNLMMVFYNEADQFVVVEIDVKVKNLDYNPYDE